MEEPKDDGDPGVPEWVVTYGDMMSLLLTFFIMLVSMSQLKSSGKMRAALNALQERFGDEAGGTGAPGRSLQTTSVLDKLSSLGSTSQGGAGAAGRKASGRGGKFLPTRRIRQGTVVTLGGPAMFEPFDATLTSPAKQSLDIIAEVLKGRLARIEIRGHASPEPFPLESDYRDHLELSFARADGVNKYLISKGINPRRILVSAAGETEPRSLTRSEAEQTWNRRVDVFMVDSYIDRPSNSPSR